MKSNEVLNTVSIRNCLENKKSYLQMPDKNIDLKQKNDRKEIDSVKFPSIEDKKLKNQSQPFLEEDSKIRGKSTMNQNNDLKLPLLNNNFNYNIINNNSRLLDISHLSEKSKISSHTNDSKSSKISNNSKKIITSANTSNNKILDPNKLKYLLFIII